MRKFFWMPIAAVVLVAVLKPVSDLINNLVWLAQPPPLPASEYPFGIFSAPGGGPFLMVIILIAVFGGGTLIHVWSRRPR